ncbi:MAG: DUF971 domain-containing protein [Alphaproteobacteria bacterium]|nr:DUF971 domain-containing protein [Alphaproteobacteria bacterium]
MAFRSCCRVKRASCRVTEAWPTEIRLGDGGRLLSVSFDDGTLHALPAELLRVESPSAEVKGHGPGQEQLVFGKRLVTITGVEPVGTYAARLLFSDGHSTGIYTWAYLAKLGREKETIWQAYLGKLKAEGRSRDP